MPCTKASTKIAVSLGIAAAMIGLSAAAVRFGEAEVGTTIVFSLIALAAALGVFTTDSKSECCCIRKLFGRKQAVEAPAPQQESNPFSPDRS